MGTLTQSTVTLQGLINNIPNLAPINNPSLTGNPKAVSPATADSSTSIATTEFVKSVNKLNNNKITTTRFNRVNGANPMTAATTVAVSISIDGGTPVVSSITKNAFGEVLQHVGADANSNFAITYTRATGHTTTSTTQTQDRTIDVNGTNVIQHRTITRNDLNEVLNITAWA